MCCTQLVAPQPENCLVGAASENGGEKLRAARVTCSVTEQQQARPNGTQGFIESRCVKRKAQPPNTSSSAADTAEAPARLYWRPRPGDTGPVHRAEPRPTNADTRPNGAGTRKARRGDSGSGSGTLWTLRTQLRAAEPAGPRSLLRARAGETPPPALRRRNCARAPRPRLRGTRGAGPGERVRAPSVCREDGDQPRISRHPL